MRINKNLDSKLQGAVEALGYEYIGGEIHKHDKTTIIRVYIDTPKGVSIDDCSAASKQVSRMLDVEDPFAGNYMLEVSSPGIEKPLFKIEHYQQIIGKMIKIKLRFPVEGRRNFKGTLLQVADNVIELEMDEKRYKFDYVDIEKANLWVDKV